MKNSFLLFIVLVCFIKCVNSQITKGNWMVGGNSSFSSSKQNVRSAENTATYFKLSPNIGYFFIDKFASGFKSTIQTSRLNFNTGVSKSTSLAIGPYLRYYFLAEEKQVNLFAESSYQYTHSTGNNGGSENINAFIFSVGPVIYFNSSVGLEFTANYELTNNEKAGFNVKTFSLGIGFQIHLERDKQQ